MPAQISSLSEITIPNYLYRPSEEYRLGLNWLTQSLLPAPDGLLAVCSSAFYLKEIVKRCPQHLTLVVDDFPDWQADLKSVQPYAWGPIKPLNVATDREEKRFRAIIWAEPQSGSALTFEVLNRLAAPGALLGIVSSGRLKSFLPEWQTAAVPAQSPVSLRDLITQLKRTGWRRIEQSGYHGLRSIILNASARLAGRFDQPATVDRLLQIGRKYYREAGMFWGLSPVRVLLARRVE